MYNAGNDMYDDVDDLWVDLLKQLLDAGNRAPSRDGDVRGELVGWHCRLDASQQKTLVTIPGRKLSASYAAAETLWYMSGSADTAMIKHYAPSYSRYESMDGTAYGAYGRRLMEPLIPYSILGPEQPSVLQETVNVLKSFKDSRQAVAAIWRPADVATAARGRCKDVPCTLSWQFLLRDGALDMIVTMRSNDAWLGFPYDVFAFTCFQRVVAAELGCRVGAYRHQVGSMHLYERHAARAEEVVKDKPWLRPRASGHGWSLDDTLSVCAIAVLTEKSTRASSAGVDIVTNYHNRERKSMLQDLVNACATKKFLEVPLDSFCSERIKRCLSCAST